MGIALQSGAAKNQPTSMLSIPTQTHPFPLIDLRHSCPCIDRWNIICDSAMEWIFSDKKLLQTKTKIKTNKTTKTRTKKRQKKTNTSINTKTSKTSEST